ncbi:MAG: rhodanese-like domain-containing protein, partial [Rhodoferax sp.]
MKGIGLIAVAATLGASTLAYAVDGAQALRLIGQHREFVVQTPNGPLAITRSQTDCASDKGYLQPLVPIKGVTPVTEIEVLRALNDATTMVIDMRD